MKEPEEFKKESSDPQPTVSRGYTEPKKRLSPTQLAWRVGLVILGLAIGFIVCGLNN